MGAVVRTTAGRVGGLIKVQNNAMRRASNHGTRKAAHRSRAIMVRKTPVDQGQMKASWKVRGRAPARGKGGIICQLINDAPYAAVIEGGARPHPIGRKGWDAIYYWVYRNRHLFFFGPRRGGTRGIEMPTQTMNPLGSRSGASVEGYNPALAAITWGIVNRIKHEGQKGKWIMRKSMDTHRRLLQEETKKSILAAAKKHGKSGGKGKGGKGGKGGGGKGKDS